ncbi:MAG: hypothetical protein IMZ71_00365 [Chloroflexi bacterium]|nr:hypothetical protein [Chloroflexota bacterium]
MKTAMDYEREERMILCPTCGRRGSQRGDYCPSMGRGGFVQCSDALHDRADRAEEAFGALKGAIDMICILCCRLNPQHKREYEAGKCSCDDTDQARALLASMAGRKAEEEK